MFKDLEKLAELRKTVQKEAHKILKDCLKEIMVKHPSIKGLGWTQYTPYFNDGEECIFTFNGLNVTKSRQAIDDDLDFYDEPWAEVDTYHDATVREGYTAEEWEDLRKLAKSLESLEEALKMGFGDHVKVLVTVKGVEVEEYEHE